MKKYLFKISISMWLLAALIYSGITGGLGCRPLTAADVRGTYQRSSGGVVDTIILSTNSTFEQLITFTNGVQWSKKGSWTLDREVIKFDGFYSAFDVDPFSHKAFVLIPPKSFAMETLWVEKGRIIKDSEQPIWFKQAVKTN